MCVHSVGLRSECPWNVPPCRADYFKLKSIKAQQTQEECFYFPFFLQGFRQANLFQEGNLGITTLSIFTLTLGRFQTCSLDYPLCPVVCELPSKNVLAMCVQHFLNYRYKSPLLTSDI